MFRTASVATLTAALVLAACGSDDDRLTQKQLTAELQPAVTEISKSFGAVFAEIGRAGESDRVPQAALDRLGQAAGTMRSEADRLADLRPPEQLEPETDRLVDGTRRHADELERLAAADGKVTVAQVADVVEQGPSVGPLRELAEQGVVQPPGADH